MVTTAPTAPVLIDSVVIVGAAAIKYPEDANHTVARKPTRRMIWITTTSAT